MEESGYVAVSMEGAASDSDKFFTTLTDAVISAVERTQSALSTWDKVRDKSEVNCRLALQHFNYLVEKLDVSEAHRFSVEMYQDHIFPAYCVFTVVAHTRQIPNDPSRASRALAFLPREVLPFTSTQGYYRELTVATICATVRKGTLDIIVGDRLHLVVPALGICAQTQCSAVRHVNRLDELSAAELDAAGYSSVSIAISCLDRLPGYKPILAGPVTWIAWQPGSLLGPHGDQPFPRPTYGEQNQAT